METVYIKGIEKYKHAVNKALYRSKLKEGKDFIIGSDGKKISYLLVWIKDKKDLRNLKLAITAKIIWKHRLQFFFTYDELNPLKEYEYEHEAHFEIL